MSKRQAETKADGLRLEYVPLGELQRAPRNPKDHDPEAIRDSIERFGYIQPIVVDERTGKLVAGHGRLDALQAMRDAGKTPPARIEVDEAGEWRVPVLRGVSFNSDAEAEAFLLSDNQTTILGGWNDEELAAMLRDLQAAEVPIIGWSEDEVERLIKVGAYERAAPNDDEPIVEPKFQILIACDTEAQQVDLLGRFSREGLNCRSLIG